MDKRLIVIDEYNSLWPKLFQIEQERLKTTLGKLLLGIHHIGSTAVPGLAAKPIIDIIISVSSQNQLDQIDLHSIGYEAKGEYGISGRRFFQKGDINRSHHLHAYNSQDPNIDRHLAFRDYLIAHSNIAMQYELLKTETAKRCNHNSNVYCVGKDSFVKHHEAQALIWKQRVSRKAPSTNK